MIMLNYSIHIFTSIVLALIYFSTFTSAPWLHAPFGVAPPKPTIYARNSCYGWLMFYNFGVDAEDNKNLAQHRDKQYDKDVELYAVIYAHVLVAFSGKRPDPSTFCSHQNYQNDILFVELPYSFRLCTVWIQMYGYKFDNNKYNRKRAKSRDKNEDVNISAWAAGYAQFIERNSQTSNPISINTYCTGVGIGYEDQIRFISFNETTDTCVGWIYMSGYLNEVDNYNNLDRARLHNNEFSAFINTFTKLYIEYLKSYKPKKNFFGQSSRSRIGDDFPLSPQQFCDIRGYGEVQRTYYNNQLPN